jgi:hypothetical protein
MAPSVDGDRITPVSEPEQPRTNSRARVLRPIIGIGGQAAAATLRPLSGVFDAATEAGVGLERRAVDRLFDSSELERFLTAALNSPALGAALQRAAQGPAVQRLIDELFETGIIDQFLDRLFTSGALDRFLLRLLDSDALWQLIDQIAASPAVTAAISQQGLGFADQVGEEVRERSRKADVWVERAARRLAHRPPRVLPPEPGPST